MSHIYEYLQNKSLLDSDLKLKIESICTFDVHPVEGTKSKHLNLHLPELYRESEDAFVWMCGFRFMQNGEISSFLPSSQLKWNDNYSLKNATRV